MLKITLKIDGMMCGMCEAHINDAIRSHFPAKKVSSSRRKGETVFYMAEAPDMERLQAILHETGYELKGVTVS